MDDILDLDAIAPQPKKVKFGGEIITVNPPKMGEFFLMAKAAQQLDPKIEGADFEKASNELQTALDNLVPELAGKNLGAAQLLALVTLISGMATPTQEDVKADVTLEKKVPSE
jgi:hypothetical protein